MEETELRRVYRFLDHDLNENALFLLDRLHALEPDTATWIHLRGLCCLRLGRYLAACEYSRDRAITGEHAGCSYVFSQACLHLDQYRDGISALEQAQRLGAQGVNDETDDSRFIPDAAAMSCLLGKLHLANGDLQSAANWFAVALDADAFMWDAFTKLCDNGIPLRVSSVFRRNTVAPQLPLGPLVEITRVNSAPQVHGHDGKAKSPRATRPFSPLTLDATNQESSRTMVQSPAKRKQGPALEGFANLAISTEATSDRGESASPDTLFPRQRRIARVQQLTNATRPDSTGYQDSAHGLKRPEKPRRLANPVPARSGISNRKSAGARPGLVSRIPRDKKQRTGIDASRGLGTQGALEVLPDATHSKYVYELFLKLGTAYYHLKRSQPRACLSILTSLPLEQQATAWVISKTARSQYEMLSYHESKTTFEVLRKVAPSWVEDLEIYSTVLWHLKKDVSLAFHSHDMMDNHFLSPQAWCAVGNSFSLQKSHDQAIKAFRRATQLEPPLPHAYSLLGHEYYDVEQYEEASSAFRRAIQIDARHYAAWVGLGKVQEALGNHERALQYHLQAEKVNPENIVILSNVAKMFDKLASPQKGLTYLQRPSVSEAGQHSAFAKLQAARLFLRLGQPSDAVRELSSVRDLIPDEAEVHFLLGQAYRLSGGTHHSEALKCFTVALSLRPQSHAIKDALLSMEK